MPLAGASLLVEEAAFSTTAGNSQERYAIENIKSAPDVSGVTNLSQAPAGDFVSKQLVANLVKCPTLNAPSREGLPAATRPGGRPAASCSPGPDGQRR